MLLIFKNTLGKNVNNYTINLSSSFKKSNKDSFDETCWFYLFMSLTHFDVTCKKLMSAADGSLCT